MTDRWERLTDLYHAVVALPPAERAQLLSEECGDDPALRADVERLIAAHDRTRPPTGSIPTIAADSQSPGIRRIGQYRVLKEVTRDAKSVVFLAERDDRRSQDRVSIQVIEQHVDTTLVLSRLYTEQQALAPLEHHSIPRLLDGGATDEGHPYFVTDYVEGEPIDDYAERLSIPDRLQLFLQVCSTVAYAHRHRVVHGGLRLANILVTAEGVPKLLGFGVSKVLDGTPASGAPTTQSDDASPEQIAGLRATQASDIYALGLALRDLLGARSAGRGRNALRDDLETIIRTALRKEPDRRYSSVDQLADDIKRYLESPQPRSKSDKPEKSEKPRRKRTRNPMRLPSALVSWGLAVAAVSLLGVKVAALRPLHPGLEAVKPPAEAPVVHPRVLLSDFADRVGDAQLVDALNDAFRVGLSQSPVVQVLSTRQPRTKAALAGTIANVDGKYTITAQLTISQKGDSSSTLTETALDSNDVMPALNRLAERVREQLGEPRSSISTWPRLDEVTTTSLAALRLYASATKASNPASIRLLKSAIAIDTGYASAYRLMASTYREMGDRGRSADAFEHAFANQARLPFYERYQMVGANALNVLNDYATAIDAYRRLLERYPDDVRALTNLAFAHAARREYAVQESLLVRAIEVDPNVPTLYTGLAMARVNNGNHDGADQALAKFTQRFSSLNDAQVASISVAASRQDWDVAERAARQRLSGVSDDAAMLDGLETLAGIIMAQGRLNEAEQTLRRAIALGARGGSPRRYLMSARRIAYLELRYRHSPAAALATIDNALVKYPLERMEESERPYDEIARLYADAGQPTKARDLVERAGRTRFGQRRGIDANRRWTLGAIAMAEGQPWQGEIEIHGAAENHACPICALPDLARAYEVAGKPDSAIATYERYVHAPWQRRYDTDDIELGSALKRLGELYQQQNDRAKASAQYTSLLRLWRGADQELEPLLADVRRRLDQTSDGGGQARE